MEEKIQELIKIAETAQEGQWMPFLIFSSLCTVIIGLVIIIGKMILNRNDKDHEEMRKLIKIQGEVNEGTLKNQTALKDLMLGNKIEITEQRVKIDNLEKKVG